MWVVLVIKNRSIDNASSSPSRAVLHAAPVFNSRWDGERIHRTTGFDDHACKAFSTSRCLFKKGAKAARDEKKASSKDQASDDPYDFTTLEGDIAAAIERLKNDLSKLRAGGRFNPEVLENLRVQPDKKLGQTVKLNDLAQVVPKGRTVQLLVGEQEVYSRSCTRSRCSNADSCHSTSNQSPLRSKGLPFRLLLSLILQARIRSCLS